VIASFDPFSFSGSEDEIDLQPTPSVGDEGDALDQTFDPTPGVAVQGSTPNTTHLIIHSAIITNVQVEQLPTRTDAESAQQSGVDLAPTGNLLVSLAMEPEEVERTVFTAEFGTVWLALESVGAVDGPTQIQTRATVYQDPTGSLDQASVK
jgi:hypothetical protein